MFSKIIGIGGRDFDYDMIKKTCIAAVRIGVPFPFTDKIYGTVSSGYINAKEQMKKAAANGIKVMGVTPLIGSIRWIREKNCALWQDSWPKSIMGYSYGDSQFYVLVEEICKWIAQDLGDLVSGIWQISNEMDTEIFRGPYSLEVAKRVAFASAKGIRSVYPDALCGINTANMKKEAIWMFENCYTDDSPLNYAGIDGYYSSWADGRVEDWDDVVARIVEITGRKVLINEWGYSSIGEVRPAYKDFEEINGISNICTDKCWFNSWRGETRHTEEIQAEYILTGLKIFEENENVIGSFIYSWRDDVHCFHCGATDCPAECGWGIIRSDNTPKAAYHKLVEING